LWYGTSPVLAQETIPGTALDFDGEDDYVDVGTVSPGGSLTYEAWIMIEGGTDIRYVQAVQQSGEAGGRLLRVLDNNILQFQVVDGTSQKTTVESQGIEQNQWYHIAGVLDTDTDELRLYVNGEEVALSTNVSDEFSTQLNNFTIGKRPDLDQEYFDGQIDEVRVWNVARTADEIRTAMHTTLDGDEAGLLAYWQLNEGSGLIAGDVSGGHDGTLINMDDTDWIDSTVPVGGGESDVQIVSNTGPVTFDATGVTMDFTSKTETDTFVATRLDLEPNTLPDGIAFEPITGRYWIVEQIGAGTFTADLTLDVGEMLDGEEIIKLFRRDSNAEGGWSLVANAASVSGTEATFAGIESLSQFIVVQATPPDTVPGTALDFNGVDDYVDVPLPNDFGADFTIEFWMQSTQTDGSGTHWWSGMGLVDGEISGQVEDFGTSLAGGKVRFGTGGTSSDTTIETPQVVADGLWHHVAAVREQDTGTLRIYIDAVEVASIAGATMDPLEAPEMLHFGSLLSGNNFYQGVLDEVRVWNVARTADEIRTAMHTTLDGDEAGLLAYWQLNEGSGLIAGDVSGGHDGTLINMDDTDWIASTAPVGGGESFTETVSDTGMVPFGATGVTMNFTSKTGTDTFVATRLDLDPNTLPDGIAIEPITGRYWIVEQIGTGAFVADLTLDVGEGLDGEEIIKLFRRDSNAEGSWSAVTNAVSISGMEATFEGIESLSQFIVARATPPDTVPGKTLDFDGTDEFVDVGTVSPSGSLTYEAWIKTNSNDIPIQYLQAVRNGENEAGGRLLRLTEGNTPDFFVFDDNGVGTGASNSTVSLTPGQWYHIAGILDTDAKELRLYVNGDQVALSTNVSDEFSTRLNNFTIGKRPDLDLNYFDGQIDEVRVWNVARTADEIRTAMHTTLDGDETGLLAYWQFNEGSSTTAADGIGGHDGTLINMDDTDWMDSTAPVSGVSSTQTAAPGTVVFGDTGLTMNFLTQNGSSITVTRIDLAPNSLPWGVTPFDSQYWVVNRVGSGLFNVSLTFALAEELSSSDTALPGQIRLYNRDSNADEDWSLVTTATSVNATTGTASFEDIRSFSQFLIARGDLLEPGAVEATDGLFEDKVEISWSGLEEMAALLKIRRDATNDGVVTEDAILLSTLASDAVLYTDTSGDPGLTYEYCVEVLDDFDAVVDTVCDTGRRVLTVPTSVAATDGTLIDQVTLSWTDRSAIEDGYTIYRFPVASDTTRIDTTLAANTSSFSDTDAEAGIDYTYCVAAFVDADANGAFDEEVDFESLRVCNDGFRGFVLPPLDVVATDGEYPTFVMITWTDQSENEDGYAINRDGEPLVTLTDDGVTTYQDSDVVSGTTYNYCVITQLGDQESEPVCDTGGIGILASPSDVAASDNVFDDKIEITWNDPGDTEDGFNIYRRDLTEVDSTLLFTTAANSEVYRDTEAAHSTDYRYCVEAFASTDDSGDGVDDQTVESKAVCDTGLRLAVLTPTLLAASDNTYEDKIEVSWTNPASTASLFKIYRRDLAETDSALVKTLSSGVTSFLDTDMASDASYRYCVVAVTALDEESTAACAIGSRSITAPTSVEAADESAEELVLITWVDNSAIETGYNVYRNEEEDETSAPLLIGSTGASKASFEDRTGVPGVTYSYSVAAFDAHGESGAGTDTGLRTLEPPSDVAAGNGTSETEVTITWTDNSRVEKGYRIYRKEEGDTDSTLVHETAAREITFTDDTVVFGITYQYSVAAFDDYGESASATDGGFTTILPPASVNASDTYPDQVVITWIDASSINTGYQITRDDEEIDVDCANLGDAATTCIDSSADEDHSYNYCVVATSASGNSEPSCDSGNRLKVAPPLTSDLTIDGFLDAPTELLEGDLLGRSVAIDGEYLIVSTIKSDEILETELIIDAGAVYIYHRTGDTWTQQVKLTADLSGQKDFVNRTPFGFGKSVAISGEWALIGAPWYEVGLEHENEGRAFFFQRAGESWEWKQDVKIDPPVADQRFGWSVDLDGETAVIGMPIHDDNDGINDVGEIHYYKLNGSPKSWMEEIALEETSVGRSGRYGWDVAVDGNHIIVGAPNADLAGACSFEDVNCDAGAVFIYDSDNDYQGTELTASDAAIREHFGYAVDISGEFAIVGAIGDQDSSTPSGSAYVFAYEDGEDGEDEGWVQIAKLTASDGTPDDYFGWSVAINENYAFVGAPVKDKDDNNNPDLNIGATYVFQHIAQEWKQVAKITPDASGDISIDLCTDEIFLGQCDNSFGTDIAINTSDLIVSIPGINSEKGGLFAQTLLAKPIAVSASDGTYDNRVQVVWQDNSLHEDGFNIYRQDKEGVYQQVGVVTANAEAFDDFDVAPGDAQKYCVEAFSNDQIGALAEQRSEICDVGWRPANGSISGRVASQLGAGIDSVTVSLEPKSDEGEDAALHNALQLDGVGGTVSTALIIDQSATTSPGYTFEAWVYPASISEEKHMLFSTSDGGYDWSILRKGATWMVWNGSDDGEISTDFSVDEAEWQHVAAVFDPSGDSGAEVRFYKNGIEAEVDITLAFDDSTNPLYLGSDQGLTKFFDGHIDEVRVWNVVRTENEIRAMMDQSLSGDETGLVGYWNFDQGFGDVALDLTTSASHGFFLGGAFWSSETAPLQVSALTDLDGNYTFDGIRYGDQTTFNVRPSKGTRAFEPSVKNITLSTESPVQNEVQFTDVSAFTISGIVQYDGTTCPVADVEMQVDGTFKNTTENDGFFSVAADIGDNRVLTPNLASHTFDPAGTTLDVQDNLFDVNFTDKTLQTLSGFAGGGCNTDIGAITARVFTADGCYDQEVVLNGTYALQLPPQSYVVQVVDVDVVDGLDKADVIQFFDNLGAQELDLSAEADTLDLIYHAPLVVDIIGLMEPLTCDNDFNGEYQVVDDQGGLLRTFNPVPLFYQGSDAIPLTISVNENYGGDVPGCPLEEGTVTVFDEIVDEADAGLALNIVNGVAVYAEDQPDLPDGTPGPRQGEVYQTYANTPSVSEGRVIDGVDRSFQKSFTAVTEVPGREAITTTEWALVLGVRPRTGTFSTLPTTNVPLLVLRDPPGDNSYSYIEKDSTICNTISGITFNQIGGGTEVSTKAGVKFSLGIGLSTETKAEATFESKNLIKAKFDGQGGLKTCVTFSERVSTSSENTFVGEDADVYIGIGMNFLFATSDQLAFENDEDMAACKLTLNETLNFGLNDADPFSTEYTYSQTHIQNTVIPQLENLKLLDPDANLIEGGISYDQAIANWNAQIAFNQSEKWGAMGEGICHNLSGTDLALCIIALDQQDNLRNIARANASADAYMDCIDRELPHDEFSYLSRILAFAASAINFLSPDPFSKILEVLKNGASISIPALECQNEADLAKESIPDPLRINRSFDAGATYEYTHSSSFNRFASNAFSIEFETEQEYVIGGEIGGTGFTGSILFQPSAEFTLISESDIEESRTVGYELSDDDIGDYFSVDVADDFGITTPVFRLVSGRSSGPWEPGTQPRDSVLLAINPPVQSDVDPEMPAVFTLSLTNASPSKETREYYLRTISTSNPGGAILKAQGSSIQSGLSFLVDPDQTQEITLEVSRGPSKYDYDDLAVMVYPPGEYSVWEDGGSLLLADTVFFDVHYTAPCSDINILRPFPNWTLNQSAENILEVTLNEFDLLRTYSDDVERIGLEYRDRGLSELWEPGQGLPATDIDIDVGTDPGELDPEKTSYSKDWEFPAPDGLYELRAFTECGTAENLVTTYSDVFPGTVDRTPPVVFGLPQPADGILNLGDNISITFDEDIDCASVITTGEGQNISLTAPDGDDEGAEPDPLSIEATCDGRTLILTPNDPDLSPYENQLLTATVMGGDDGLTDLLGNQLENLEGGADHVWKFTVRQSGFSWSPVNIELDVSRGAQTTLATSLLNGRAQPITFHLPESFDITHKEGGDPVSLTPSVTTGTIVAGGTKTIQFTLPDTLALGAWTGTLTASATEGDAGSEEELGEALFDLTAHIVCNPPEWNVIASNFPYSMSLTGQLFIEGVASDDVNDVVVAMVDGEVRGVAPVSSVSDRYQVNMLVYHTAATGGLVSFQVWDQDNCTLYPEVSPSLVFDNTATHGSFDQPIPIEAPPPLIENAIALASGWTWFSVNTDGPTDVNVVLAEVDAAEGDLIKQQDGSLHTYTETTTPPMWVGTLPGIVPGEGYLINLSLSNQLELTGSAIQPGTITLPLDAGWNWIGYLPQEALTVNEALEDLAPAPDTSDVLKSQYAFAEFVPGPGWVGSLTMMEPGLGYKLKVTEGGTLTYPDPNTTSTVAPASKVASASVSEPATGQPAPSSAREKGVALAEEGATEADPGKRTPDPETTARAMRDAAPAGPGWTVDPQHYPHTMTFTARVHRDGEVLRSPASRVAVFAGDEVRGVARLRYLPALKQHLAFMLIYGDDRDEALELRFYDAERDVVYAGLDTLRFEADAAVGNVTAPAQVLLTEALMADTEVPDALPKEFTLSPNYPNPFNPITTIRYALPQSEHAVLEVFDVMGRRVAKLVDETQPAGRYAIRFDAGRLASGIYFYRLHAGTFIQVRRMVLLK
jgi:hypothetical protein